MGFTEHFKLIVRDVIGPVRRPLTSLARVELLRRDCLENPLNKIERARFVGTYGANENLMKLASVARLIRRSVSKANWLYLAEEYPENALRVNALKTKHAEAKMRAYFLYHALVRLLKLVGAPPQMSRDLKLLLLDPNMPRQANGRARLQKKLLEGCEVTVRPLGKTVRSSYAEIKSDIDKKYVVVPPSVRLG